MSGNLPVDGVVGGGRFPASLAATWSARGEDQRAASQRSRSS